MKTINVLAVVLAVMAGRGYAADFAGLQAFKAGDIAAAAEGVQREGFSPGAFGGLETCRFSGVKEDKCVYKCESGAIVMQPKPYPSISVFSNGGCAKLIMVPKQREGSDPAAMKAGSLALMRSDAEIITSQFLNNGTKAARDAWKHAALRAGDGTGIGVDYSIVNLGGSVIAAPVWINVTNPAFRGGERVKAVLMNYHEGGSAPQIQRTQEIDLKYSGNGRYTAEAGQVLLSESHIGYGYNFRQEIAVAVDGKWLKDPVGGSGNFRFKMAWY